MTSLPNHLKKIVNELKNNGFEVLASDKCIKELLINIPESDNIQNSTEVVLIRTKAATKRFKENPLLILKCLRYASTLNLFINNETSKAIHEHGYLINNISVGDIKDEFVKILCGDNVEYILREYSDIFEVFIPEIHNMIGFDQHTPYHKYDVWEHTIHAVSISENTPLIRIVLFFHDIAKPDCLTIDKNGIGHFKDHALLGAEKTKKILIRMNFPRKEIENITMIIANHRHTYKCEADVKKIINQIGKELFFELIKVKRADDSSKGFSNQKDHSLLDFAESIAKEIILISNKYSNFK